MPDDIDTVLRRMVDDPAAAHKLGRLVRAAVTDVEARFKHLPPSAAERLLAALLNDDTTDSLSKLLGTLAEAGGSTESSQP